ncbi:hypothetical protein [Nostoc sp.]|uniref:hypothetical protein n=1 Tax=Nostoc sp. TaxID=1180 RepID=UPI002FFB4F6E
MTHNSLPSQLYLLAPGNLPVEQQLSELNQVKIRQILKHLLQALDEPSDSEALDIINQELNNLEIGNISPASISSTETSIEPWEIEDFNSCFKATYVTTKESSVCLVWGLLVVYKTLLVFNEDGKKLDFNRVKELKEGLKSYVYLLGRVFSLSLEEI